jgi:hypothetical protein
MLLRDCVNASVSPPSTPEATLSPGTVAMIVVMTLVGVVGVACAAMFVLRRQRRFAHRNDYRANTMRISRRDTHEVEDLDNVTRNSSGYCDELPQPPTARLGGWFGETTTTNASRSLWQSDDINHWQSTRGPEDARQPSVALPTGGASDWIDFTGAMSENDLADFTARRSRVGSAASSTHSQVKIVDETLSRSTAQAECRTPQAVPGHSSGTSTKGRFSLPLPPSRSASVETNSVVSSNSSGGRLSAMRNFAANLFPRRRSSSSSSSLTPRHGLTPTDLLASAGIIDDTDVEISDFDLPLDGERTAGVSAEGTSVDSASQPGTRCNIPSASGHNDVYTL